MKARLPLRFDKLDMRPGNCNNFSGLQRFAVTSLLHFGRLWNVGPSLYPLLTIAFLS